MAKKHQSAFDMPELVGVISSVYSDIHKYASRIESVFGEGSYFRVMSKAFEKITDPMYEDMRDFVSKGKHYRSGNTLTSLSRGQMVVDDEGNRVTFKLGFDMNKGGFPALILEYGDKGSPMRMPNTAYFFVHWSVKNHKLTHFDADNEIFKPILEELNRGAERIGQ